MSLNNTKSTIKDHVQAAQDYLNLKRTQWDEYENLFYNRLDTGITSETKSQVFDPKLATLSIERANRVMAQMPMGKVRNISSNDEGKAKLMNLILDKYIIPNANSQFDLLTKFRMVDLYSNIYGSFYVFVDMVVNPNGYTGSDMWLLNIRDVFPQVGSISLEDSDRVVVRTWQPISYFENLNKKDGFINVDKIINKLKENKGGSKPGRDQDSMTQREINDLQAAVPGKNGGYFEVFSMYERDHWVDYVSDADEIFRDQGNPHKNNELPVIQKHSNPLMDDPIGMGDFERGKPMQKVINSLWNMYLDAVKISIFPPVLLNKDNIASPSSIKWNPAAKWLGRNNIGNFAMPMNLTPQGVSTFNNTYQVSTASLLNIFGTSDTAISTEVDPGFGKTPQALKMQQQRENTRDNADRFYMEQFVKKVMNRFTNLIAKKQSSQITIRLFGDEIEELAQSYPEIAEMYNQDTGKLSIKGNWGSTVFDYEMVSGSTYQIDEKATQDNLLSILDLFVKNPNLIQYLEQMEGKKVNIGELITRIISNSNIRDWDKIITDMNQPQGQGMEQDIEPMLQQQQQQFADFIGQMQGGGMNPDSVPPMQQPMGQQMPMQNAF